MSGDMSLSAALGGLRIANPDDADTDAPPAALTIVDTPYELTKTTSHASSMRNTYDRQPPYEKHYPQQLQHQQSPPPPPTQQQQQQPLPSHSQLNRDGFGSGAPVPTTAEEWKDRGSAVGVKREIDADGRPVIRQFKKGVRDFNFGVVLGEGSYSSVFLASDRQTLKDYAVKVLDKRHIIKEKKIKYVNIEKNTLNRLTEHPGIVRLYYTFQDQTSLYYVLDLCNGGELLGALKKTGTFDVECTRFYGAEILDAIDYMHSRGVIHRDLKPENVLLDDHMHIKITDFGTAKLLSDPRLPPDGNTPSSEDDRAASFVGTAEYNHEFFDASGDEKKVKQEISLLASDCVWRTQQDAKGMMHWCVDTGGIHYSFEEPKTPTPDNKIANEWIESLERAKDIALSQASFSDYNDNGYSENRPVSPASTLGGHSTYTDNFGNGSGASSSRVNAAKNSSTDEFATKRSRFSKRQSKSGLGPVF
ncbi:Serine/threonine-protein kinase ksg1 [Ceratocystis platani]|uniref:non-specific serine/threonine protein kinase n=1 Tax=Ceratocystis fimbriata f. sp. platani TaxID=88771 RepID=A0A0F8AWT9_CERFI|nr:Serine/threonine-protein kinase ksg1 [Ceratocystis platani]